MKKKLLILVCVIGLSFTPLPIAKQEAKAQFAVVDLPHAVATVAGWIADAKTWIDQLKEMAAAQALREALQGIEGVQQLESILELAQLIDDVACLTTDFQFYMNLNSNYTCLKFLNFQRVTTNLKLSTDLISKIVTVSSFFSMNSEGRMAFLDQAKLALEKAADEMANFNSATRFHMMETANKNYSKKVLFNVGMASFNRYTD